MLNKYRLVKRFEDKEIIEILKNASKDENAVLRYLYFEHCETIQRLILKKGGSKDEVPDIFQDTIIVFYENVKEGKFKLNSSIKAYLKAVAFNLWCTSRRKKKDVNFSEESESLNVHCEEEEEVIDLEWDKTKVVMEVLDNLSPDCKQILFLSIYKKMSMDEISKVLSYKNAQIARNKKSKCLNYLRNIINGSPRFKEIINEIYFKD